MKLFIAIPTHSATITIDTAMTVISLTNALARDGHPVLTNFYSGAMIADIRNSIVADFMVSDYDTLLMLDSDQAAPTSMLLKMLGFQNPVVGCLYPRRVYYWENVGPVTGGQTFRDLLYQSQIFVGDLVPKTGPSGETQYQINDGFAEASRVGTGCLIIRRNCIETMAAHYPELKGKGFSPGDFPTRNPEWNYGFFNAGWSDEHGRVMSEDFYFCDRWLGTGGKIYASVSEDNTHVGRQLFTGNYVGFLKATIAVKT